MRIPVTRWHAMAAVLWLGLAAAPARCSSPTSRGSRGLSHVYTLAASPAGLCAGPCNKPRRTLIYRGIVLSHVSDHRSRIAILRNDGAIDTYNASVRTGKFYVKYAKLLCWYRDSLVLTSNGSPLIYNTAIHRLRSFPALRNAWYVLPSSVGRILVSDAAHGTRIDLLGRFGTRRRTWSIGKWGRGDPLVIRGRFLVVNDAYSSEDVSQNLKVVDLAKGTIRDLIRGETLLGWCCKAGCTHIIVSTPGGSYHDGVADTTVVSEIELTTGKRKIVCKVNSQLQIVGQINGTARFLGVSYSEAHGPGELVSFGRRGEPRHVLDSNVYDAFPSG